MAAKGHNSASVKDNIQVLKEKFEMYDRDHDEGLSISEFRDLLLESGCPMSDRAIAKFCVDLEGCQGDRKITMAEIAHLEDFVLRVETLFNELDVDQSGFLDIDELKQLLKNCGQDDDNEIDGLLESVDRSGDGKIPLNEFLDAVLQN